MFVAMPTAIPRRAVDQQVGKPRREHRGLDLGAIVVGGEVDRFLVDVGEQLVRHLPHAHLGVAHRGGRIAVHGAEVALPVDEHHPHGERLRHANERVVHRALSVGVVFADRVADDPGRLLVGFVPVVSELAHRMEHAPVGPVSGHLGRREAPCPRSRSWRNRDRTASSRPRCLHEGFPSRNQS